MASLFTIGYEKATLAAVAASRRPGFSKRQRAAKLWHIYDKHIQKPESQQALGELVGLIKSGKRIALLCYCRDPQTCHRSRIVAQVKKRMQLKVEDLIPPLF